MSVGQFIVPPCITNLISPKYLATKLIPGCTVDDKIDVFEDWMNGWLLRHAHALCDDKYVFRKDAGFVVLMLTTAYFEPIESYHTGQSSNYQSKIFFRRGFLRVFSGLSATLAKNGFADPDSLAHDIADEVYIHLRCGLFHEGGTKHKLMIRDDTAPLGFMLEVTTGHVGSIVIDPRKFLAEVQNHLQSYVMQLRDPSQIDLRQKFQAFFDQRISTANQTVLPPLLLFREVRAAYWIF
jgi:hypothetical protein